MNDMYDQVLTGNEDRDDFLALSDSVRQFAHAYFEAMPLTVV
jgi:hypothetical protein